MGLNGANLIAQHLYKGVLSNWDIVSDIVGHLNESDAPFENARELGKTCKDFLDYVKTDGDKDIQLVSNLICQKIFEIMSEDYEKQATSVLLCTINKITEVNFLIKDDNKLSGQNIV